MDEGARVVRSIPSVATLCRYCKRVGCKKAKLIRVPGERDRPACCQCRVGPLGIEPGEGVERARAEACDVCAESSFRCTYCGTELCENVDWTFSFGPLPTGVPCCVCCDYDDNPRRGRYELEEMCPPCARRERVRRKGNPDVYDWDE